MVKDGQDLHGLQTTNLEQFRLNFLRCTSGIAPLNKYT